MTKDELWKTIESQSWDDKAETILKTAVDRYLEALLKQCNVSGELPLDEADRLIKSIVVNEANFNYIAGTKVINGSLLQDLRRVLNEAYKMGGNDR